MRRRIVIALLALGTVVGYGSGIAHAVRWHCVHHAHCAGWHHEQHGEPQQQDPRDPRP
jgi:hypothetical protein